MPDFPIPIGDVLKVLAARGHVDHLSLSYTNDRRWQAAARRAPGEAYRVSIQDDLDMALLGALGPDHGHPWTELLGDEFAGFFDAETLVSGGVSNPLRAIVDDDYDPVDDVL